ncbi:MAG: MBOAT family protein [Burkholderiaceae bacterium]
MLFNSPLFIFAFLPVTFAVYFWLNHKRLSEAAKGWLVLSSLFFYSWWNPIYLPLILGSMLFNFWLGARLARGASLLWLVAGVAVNLSALGYFKYADFFIANANLVFGVEWDTLNLVLPLAISFFTFQQIAFLVDSYRREMRELNFLNYAVFVSFFPQLIAGPIVHHREMMPQFASLRAKVIHYPRLAAGLVIFSTGLFKKVVIADSFAPWANAGFDGGQALGFLEAWVTSLAYTFQLYFDFSGYSDMAIGLALLFNIRLPFNFNSPYRALSIQDFWRRWHMTLSRFLRDYLYVPLGGNRKGSFRTYGNLMVTFVLGGLWHGAAWTFVFWGFLHGLALACHRAWQSAGIAMPRVLAWLLTFLFVNAAWVFFRAEQWSDATRILSGMAGFAGWRQNGLSPEFPVDASILVGLIAGFVICLALSNMNRVRDARVRWTQTVLAALMFAAAVITSAKTSSEVFLYFNF